MKKFLYVLVLLLVITASLAAGGQQEGKDSQEVKSEKVTLSYVTWMTKGEDAYWIDAFMAENPDIEVKMEMLEGGKYQELMRTRLLSNDIPDVMLLMGDQIKDYGREGYLADLSGTYAADLQKSAAMANEFCTIDGKVVGISVTGGFQGYVWYNKKLFADLGLNVPETMDEFWAVMEALKQAGKDPMLLGGADTWTYKMLRFSAYTQLVGPAIATTGLGDVYEAIYKGSVSAIYGEHAAFIEKLVKGGYLTQASLTTTWPQSSQIFADGNVGVFPQGPWMTGLPEIQSADPEKFELGVFALPAETSDGKRYVIANMDRFLAVSGDSEYQEAAMKLFNFMTSKKMLSGYLESQGLTTLLDLDYDLPSQIIEFKNLVTGSKYTSVPAIFPTPAGFGDQEGMLGKNIQSGASAAEALAEMEQFYNDSKDTIKF